MNSQYGYHAYPSPSQSQTSSQQPLPSSSSSQQQLSPQDSPPLSQQQQHHLSPATPSPVDQVPNAIAAASAVTAGAGTAAAPPPPTSPVPASTTTPVGVGGGAPASSSSSESALPTPLLQHQQLHSPLLQQQQQQLLQNGQGLDHGHANANGTTGATQIPSNAAIVPTNNTSFSLSNNNASDNINPSNSDNSNNNSNTSSSGATTASNKGNTSTTSGNTNNNNTPHSASSNIHSSLAQSILPMSSPVLAAATAANTAANANISASRPPSFHQAQAAAAAQLQQHGQQPTQLLTMGLSLPIQQVGLSGTALNPGMATSTSASVTPAGMATPSPSTAGGHPGLTNGSTLASMMALHNPVAGGQPPSHPSAATYMMAGSVPSMQPSNHQMADLEHILTKYGSDPDLLRLIIASKTEEDRRLAEEARLKIVDMVMRGDTRALAALSAGYDQNSANQFTMMAAAAAGHHHVAPPPTMMSLSHMSPTAAGGTTASGTKRFMEEGYANGLPPTPTSLYGTGFPPSSASSTLDANCNGESGASTNMTVSSSTAAVAGGGNASGGAGTVAIAATANGGTTNITGTQASAGGAVVSVPGTTSTTVSGSNGLVVATGPLTGAMPGVTSVASMTNGASAMQTSTVAAGGGGAPNAAGGAQGAGTGGAAAVAAAAAAAAAAGSVVLNSMTSMTPFPTTGMTINNHTGQPTQMVSAFGMPGLVHGMPFMTTSTMVGSGINSSPYGAASGMAGFGVTATGSVPQGAATSANSTTTTAAAIMDPSLARKRSVTFAGEVHHTRSQSLSSIPSPPSSGNQFGSFGMLGMNGGSGPFGGMNGAHPNHHQGFTQHQQQAHHHSQHQQHHQSPTAASHQLPPTQHHHHQPTHSILSHHPSPSPFGQNPFQTLSSLPPSHHHQQQQQQQQGAAAHAALQSPLSPTSHFGSFAQGYPQHASAFQQHNVIRRTNSLSHLNYHTTTITEPRLTAGRPRNDSATSIRTTEPDDSDEDSDDYDDDHHGHMASRPGSALSIHNSIGGTGETSLALDFSDMASVSGSNGYPSSATADNNAMLGVISGSSATSSSSTSSTLGSRGKGSGIGRSSSTKSAKNGAIGTISSTSAAAAAAEDQKRKRKRREMQPVNKIVESPEPHNDPYLWKNNGNTTQKKTGCKSIYYKCSNSNNGCTVNKTVTEKEGGGYVTKYRGEHLDDCLEMKRRQLAQQAAAAAAALQKEQ